MKFLKCSVKPKLPNVLFKKNLLLHEVQPGDEKALEHEKPSKCQTEPQFGKTQIKQIEEMPSMNNHQPEMIVNLPKLTNTSKMPSTVIARIMLIILLLQFLLCIFALITTSYSSLKFVPYHKILPNFMQRYGLFLGVFIINLYATLITIVAAFRIHKFCFVETARLPRNFANLKLLKYELLTSGAATILSGSILFILCSSWQVPIRDNILYAIKYAISDNDYAQDINIIQQRFECCGISMHGAESHLIWLLYLSPDIAFQENLYSYMNSLPWSCCRSNYQSMICYQFAYERFIVPFNETNFIRIPSYALRFKKNWECISLEDCKEKRELALNSVYKEDCGVAFYQAFKKGFFHLNGTISILLGTFVMFGIAATSHLERTVQRENSFKVITFC